MPTEPIFITDSELDSETIRWSEQMERIFMRGRDEAVAENERLGLKEEDFLPSEGSMTSRVAEDSTQEG